MEEVLYSVVYYMFFMYVRRFLRHLSMTDRDVFYSCLKDDSKVILNYSRGLCSVSGINLK